MNSLELVDSFSEFKELKSIDKQTMQHVLEEILFSFLINLYIRLTSSYIEKADHS